MRFSVAVCLLALAGPARAQEHPFDRFIGSYEVVESTLPAPGAEIVFESVAAGLGIHSVWRHGSGDSFYEAHALWGYDPASKQVEVLEVNSEGVVASNVGGFDDTGSLTMRRFADDGVTVLERRVFTWRDANTLAMSLEFIGSEATTRHSITIRRR
jgi:hypothetical protein